MHTQVKLPFLGVGIAIAGWPNFNSCLVAMHSVRNQINFSFAAWDDMKLKEAQSGGKNSPCSKIPELNFD